MTPFKMMAIVPIIVLLSACQGAVDTTSSVAKDAAHSFSIATNAIIDAFSYNEPPEKKLPPKRYCYRADTDVVCYKEPRFESTMGNLTGAQGYDREGATAPGDPILYPSTVTYREPFMEDDVEDSIVVTDNGVPSDVIEPMGGPLEANAADDITNPEEAPVSLMGF